MAAIKGEIPDVIPYAPRLDLWYAAHSAADTLPVKYKNSSVDEICRAEGWGLYKVTADYKYIHDSAEDIALVSLGLFALPMPVMLYRLQRNWLSEFKVKERRYNDEKKFAGREKARNILETHKPDPLPGNVLAALLSIVKDAEDELSIELNEEIVNKYRVE